MKMDLHKWVLVDERTDVMRVPRGIIYKSTDEEGRLSSLCFVPCEVSDLNKFDWFVQRFGE